MLICCVVQSCPTLRDSRFLCSWDSPGKNLGAGCHFLFRGIFLTQVLNPPLLQGRWISFFQSLIHLGSPNFIHPSVELKMIRERNDKYFCSKSQGSTLIKDPDYRKWTLCKQNNCLDPNQANRGLHHFWRLCVQGQYIKTIGRHGCPVDVSNKE